MCSIKQNSTIPSKRQRISRYISAFALVLFLCAFLSHSEHITSHTSQLEQQECYLCSQGLDTVKANHSISLLIVQVFQNVAINTELMLAQSPYFGLPLLRAPPRF